MRGDHGRGPLVRALRPVLPGCGGVAGRAGRRGESRDGVPVGAAVPARFGMRLGTRDSSMRPTSRSPVGGGTCTGRWTSSARSSTYVCLLSGTPPRPAASSSARCVMDRRRSRWPLKGQPVPAGAGRTGAGGRAPDRAVPQQPNRSRSWSAEGAATADARTQTHTVSRRDRPRTRLRAEPPPLPLRTRHRHPATSSARDSLHRARSGDLSWPSG
jgi:hypothetical protein